MTHCACRACMSLTGNKHPCSEESNQTKLFYIQQASLLDESQKVKTAWVFLLYQKAESCSRTCLSSFSLLTWVMQCWCRNNIFWNRKVVTLYSGCCADNTCWSNNIRLAAFTWVMKTLSTIAWTSWRDIFSGCFGGALHVKMMSPSTADFQNHTQPLFDWNNYICQGGWVLA